MKYVLLWLVVAVTPFAFSQQDRKAAELVAKAKESFRKYTPDGYKDAIKLYEKSIEYQSNAPAYAGLAETYALLGFETEQSNDNSARYYAQAIDNASKALSIDSNSALAHRALAVAYFNKDAKAHGDIVFNSLNRALTLDTNDAETFYWLWLHMDNDNPDSPLILKALRLNDKLFRAHYALGVLYARRGEYDKATSHYKICKSINEKNYRPWFGQGIAYSRQKKYEAAIVEYRKTLSLNSDIKEAYLYLGLAYYYTDRDDEARKTLKKYLELVPDSQNKPTVDRILNELN